MAQQHYQKFANAQHSPTPDFKVDNKVFVKAQFFRTTWSSKKLSEKYFRPYKIMCLCSNLPHPTLSLKEHNWPPLQL